MGYNPVDPVLVRTLNDRRKSMPQPQLVSGSVWWGLRVEHTQDHRQWRWFGNTHGFDRVFLWIYTEVARFFRLLRQEEGYAVDGHSAEVPEHQGTFQASGYSRGHSTPMAVERRRAHVAQTSRRCVRYDMEHVDRFIHQSTSVLSGAPERLPPIGCVGRWLLAQPICKRLRIEPDRA